MSNKRTALYPGSFDPFTKGHYDVLEQALRLFDSVIVAVGWNMNKNGFLSHEQRMEIIDQAVAPLRDRGCDIKIISYDGLTADLCRNLGIEIIVRGVRTSTEFEQEMGIAQANNKLCEGLTTVMIPSTPEHAFVSSSLVREIVSNGGDASVFLPEGVNFSQFFKR
ncbi:MAG: pantetheine-phosphate adenylyltransferase [Bacteroidales bacterium]|nr:pantetheine-phosphate adenylyltransferase [Bacteroidales bacterium]